MGNNSFAPFSVNPNSFVVQNIALPKKTIMIFNYPINYGASRDLMKIPGVSESDIRASLLKGELNHKIKAGEVIIGFSDIDLLQFNSQQMAFLQNAGVSSGLQVTSANMAIVKNEDVILIGNVDGSNTVFKIPSGKFIENQPLYKIIVYLNGVKQAFLDDYFIAESGGPGTGFDTVIMSVPPEAVPAPSDVVTADYYVNNT